MHLGLPQVAASHSAVHNFHQICYHTLNNLYFNFHLVSYFYDNSEPIGIKRFFFTFFTLAGKGTSSQVHVKASNRQFSNTQALQPF